MTQPTGTETPGEGLATAVTSYRVTVTAELESLVTQMISAILTRGAALKEQVQREAEEMLGELSQRRDDLERELARLREERQTIVREMDEERRRATQEAQAIRDAAEREAAAIRSEAERYASEITAQARDRRAALQVELSALETQIARARERVAALLELQTRLFERPAQPMRELVQSEVRSAPPAERRAAEGLAEAERSSDVEPVAASPSANGSTERADAQATSAEDGEDTLVVGPSEVVIESVPGYATALALEGAIRGIPGVKEVGVKSFHRGTLVLEVDGGGTIDLAQSISGLSGLGLTFRGAQDDRVLRFVVTGESSSGLE